MLKKHYIAFLTVLVIGFFAIADAAQKPSKPSGESIKETILAIGKTGKELGMTIGRNFQTLAKETGKTFKNMGEELKDVIKKESK